VSPEGPITNLGKFHRWFFVLALAFLCLQFYHFWKELHPEWMGYQEDYLRYLKKKSEEPPYPKVDPDFHVEVKQIVPDSFASVDRCTSCHAGIDDPLCAGAPEPLTVHPGLYLSHHPAKDFGCVWCHGGDGFGVSYEGAAHHPVPDFADPMARRELIESRCGFCHKGKVVPGAPDLTLGRNLIKEGRCVACHNIPGYEREEVPRIALDGLGLKVRRMWLQHWLENPEGWLDKPRMPRFRFQGEELQNLVAFLVSQQSSGFRQDPVALDKADSEAGKILFRESRCISCHSVEGKGGTVSPDLAKIGSKVRAEWLYAFLKNPHGYNPMTLMPQFNFTDKELLNLTAYMMQEFISEDEQEPVKAGGDAEKTGENQAGKASAALEGEAESKAEAPNAVLLGRQVYLEKGCHGCHTLSSVTGMPKVGPDLSGLGQRSEEILEFGRDTETRRTLPNWVFRKVKQPETFDPRAKMPRFLFTGGEVLAITIELLSLRKQEPPLAKIHAPPEATGFKLQGEFGRIASRYRCLSCHRIYGNGGDISQAPLDYEGSQVKAEWLFQYLKDPYTIRPMVTERMVKLRMTDEEARILTDTIKLVFVDDSVPTDIGKRIQPGDAEAGKALFQTLGCYSCHILDKTGGYVGPRLANVGARMELGWFYAWLKDPQRYKPDTIEPKRNLPERQLIQVAAYLSTLVEGKQDKQEEKTK
jgi:cytochrome c2